MKQRGPASRLAGMLLLMSLLQMSCVPRATLPVDGPAFALHTIHADDTALRLSAEAGAAAIVQLFEWRLIEPQPGEYHWEYPDFVARACEYYGLQLIMRLDHPPDWALRNENDARTPFDLDAFAAFVQRVASRYRGRVLAYIIWNEPNLSREWNGQPPSPAGYADMLGRAGAAIEMTDPAALVVCAGLAPTRQNDSEAMDDLLYLRDMLATIEGRPFDVLAAHPYAFGLAPDAPMEANQGLNARRVQQIHQILVEAGLDETPIWITEMGWTHSASGGVAQTPVDVTTQAAYLLQSFEIARREWPWVELLTVWNLSAGLPADDEKAGYSIVEDTYTPLPAYEALAERFGLRHAAEALSERWRTRVKRNGPVEILAPDVAIRLGDRDTFYPHWARIYGGHAPSREWSGIFYVENPGQNAWQLSLEIMQVEEQGNLVQINGQPVEPPVIPLRGRPDYSSVWTQTAMRVPTGLLRSGANEICVTVSPRLPAQQFVRYESMQFRNLRLEPMRGR